MITHPQRYSCYLSICIVYLCKIPGPCKHVVMGTRPDESRLVHDVLLSLGVILHVHTILCVCVCVGGEGDKRRECGWWEVCWVGGRRECACGEWVSVQDHTSHPILHSHLSSPPPHTHTHYSVPLSLPHTRTRAPRVEQHDQLLRQCEHVSCPAVLWRHL